RAVDANAEYEQIAERIEHIPKDEEKVRDPDLGFSVEDGLQRAHTACPRWAVSSTNTSSRLAPPISTRKTCPRADNRRTKSSTASSPSFRAISIVVRVTFSRTGCSASSSLTRPSGIEVNVIVTS